jgi:hypothetical protein
VRDVNADNNLRARKITIGADLTLEAVNVLTSGGGGIIDVRDTTTNLFAGPAAATVTGFYLSTKPTLSGSLGRIGERTIPEFTGRGRSKGKSTLEVPGTVAAGTYYLVGRADDTGALTEVDEGNNLLAVPVQIGPDLIVSRLVAPPSAPRGTEITASNRVRNRGHTRAGESTVAFALARGANCDEDVRPLTTREAGPLDPAVESRAETKVGLPATLDPGDYCIVATADSGNAVTEVLEGNNRQAVRLTVQ